MSLPLATCQCDAVPDRPCPAAITQEDLLCDTCRAANQPGMLHTASSFFNENDEVIVRSHGAVSAEAVSRVFAPEGS
jgi:hypothetical protein